MHPALHAAVLWGMGKMGQVQLIMDNTIDRVGKRVVVGVAVFLGIDRMHLVLLGLDNMAQVLQRGPDRGAIGIGNAGRVLHLPQFPPMKSWSWRLIRGMHLALLAAVPQVVGEIGLVQLKLDNRIDQGDNREIVAVPPGIGRMRLVLLALDNMAQVVHRGPDR